METRFLCIQGGRKYYAVILNGEQIFAGTLPECGRFMKIHDAKVAEEHAADLRPLRARAVPVTTYRQARIRA
jgi:hypothetical protein